MNFNISQSPSNNLPIPPESIQVLQSQRHNSNKKGQYTLRETLGEGAFAKVKLAIHNPTQEKIAIKIINKSSLLKEERDVIRIKQEITILKKMRHKNIIQLYEIMESKNTLYIVMEYCEGKELYDYIVKQNKLDEGEACHFFQQIINGIEYLHDQHIIHRDLKPENILLDNDGNIKISDFGLSTFFSKGNLLQTPCGTPSYAPPEMLKGEEYNGQTSDVWSCGVILYAMLCGSIPFAESKEELIIQKIMSKDYKIPDFISKQAKDLLEKILKIDPLERLTIDQIKRHPWFNLIQADLRPGISLEKQSVPIDENILIKVQEYGHDSDKCRDHLQKNKFDSLTTLYYLLLKQHIKNGGKSISDLYSDEYLSYIIKTNGSSHSLKDPPSATSTMTIDKKDSPCCKKVESKLQPKLHHNSIILANVSNPISHINHSQPFKDSFATSFISNKKDKESKAKALQNNINNTITAPMTTFSIESNNKQLHLAKHALYKKKRQELTKLKKNQLDSQCHQQSNTLTNKINKQLQLETESKKFMSIDRAINENNFMSNQQIKTIENNEMLLDAIELNKVESLSSNRNIIEYIAKKIIGNSFYGSFDIADASRKAQIEKETKNKEDSKDDNFIGTFPSNSDYDMLIKGKNEKDDIADESIKKSIDNNFISKIKNNIKDKPDIEVKRPKKSIKHSFIKKQEVYIYDYGDKTVSNDHVNKFLDLSTTQLENSVEKSISMNKDRGYFSKSPENNQHNVNKEDIIVVTKSNNSHNPTGKIQDSQIDNIQLKKCKNTIRKTSKGKQLPLNTLTNNIATTNPNINQKTTITFGSNLNKKYTIHLMKPNITSDPKATVHFKSHGGTASIKTTNTFNGIKMNTNETVLELRKHPNSGSLGHLSINTHPNSHVNSNKTLTAITALSTKGNQIISINNSTCNNNSNNHQITKPILLSKHKNSSNHQSKNELTTRDKLIPRQKASNGSIESSIEKSIKHSRTASANESLLKKNIFGNKIEINLNETIEKGEYYSNDTCKKDSARMKDAIRIHKGPFDLICCSTLAPMYLFNHLIDLFKKEKLNYFKLGPMKMKCTKSLLVFECEVMLLDFSSEWTLYSYAKFRFKQGDFKMYRKMLLSIGQSIQSLG